MSSHRCHVRFLGLARGARPTGGGSHGTPWSANAGLRDGLPQRRTSASGRLPQRPLFPGGGPPQRPSSVRRLVSERWSQRRTSAETDFRVWKTPSETVVPGRRTSSETVVRRPCSRAEDLLRDRCPDGRARVLTPVPGQILRTCARRSPDRWRVPWNTMVRERWSQRRTSAETDFRVWKTPSETVVPGRRTSSETVVRRDRRPRIPVALTGTGRSPPAPRSRTRRPAVRSSIGDRGTRAPGIR